MALTAVLSAVRQQKQKLLNFVKNCSVNQQGVIHKRCQQFLTPSPQYRQFFLAILTNFWLLSSYQWPTSFMDGPNFRPWNCCGKMIATPNKGPKDCIYKSEIWNLAIKASNLIGHQHDQKCVLIEFMLILHRIMHEKMFCYNVYFKTRSKMCLD